MSKLLLDIKGLKTHFFTKKGTVKAVDGVTFKLYQGETVGIVGESGSGKSITALSILKLIDSPGKIVEGDIFYKNENLIKKSEKDMMKIRGNKISMIFQEPMTSLNPVFKVGAQIAETLIIHSSLDKKKAEEEAIKMLEIVGIPSPKTVFNNYPYELSGGMCQRIMIAIALCCNPDILIADEPTTALDVTIQAQILYFMNKLKKEKNTSIILITHDLGVVAEMADYVVVMYCGKVVETAPVMTIFGKTTMRHPYTAGLLNSLPDISKDENKELEVIEGAVPNPLYLPKGCSFAPRCKYVFKKCLNEKPTLHQIKEKHEISCFYIENGGEIL
ncbi:MAG: ABC transporter ATP-binding protein [Fusobacteriaceae bacterium]